MPASAEPVEHTYPALARLETVKDAHHKRYMKAATARLKGRAPQQEPEVASAHSTGASATTSRGKSARPTTSRLPTKPQEPRLSDSLACFLTSRVTPAQKARPTDHKRALPTCYHTAGTQYEDRSGSGRASVLAGVLQPPQPLLDPHTQDCSAAVYSACEVARDSGVLMLRGKGLTVMPGQLSRFLLSQGRCLTHVDLSHNSLSHCPPLEQLPSLSHLDLSHNTLCALGESLGLLTQLTCLVISHNRLTALPHSTSQLTGLRVVDVSHNDIETLPCGLGQLRSLNDLQVSHNRLHCLPPSLSALCGLTRLDCSHNQLTALPSGVGECRALGTLCAAHNSITALPETLGNLHAVLTSLHLDHNSLTVLPRQLALLTSLHTLTLHSSPLVVPPVHVAQEGVLSVRQYLSVFTPAMRFGLCRTHTFSTPHTPQPSSSTHPPTHTHDTSHEATSSVSESRGPGADSATHTHTSVAEKAEDASALHKGQGSDVSQCDVCDVEEMGELLLHLQLERDRLESDNKQLTEELTYTRRQLHTINTEATELRTALHTTHATQHTSEASHQPSSAPQTVHSSPDDMPSHSPHSHAGTSGRGLVYSEDVISLARRVHQLEVRVREAESSARADRARCVEAEELLTAETTRRKQVEASTGSLILATESLHAAREALRVSSQRVAHLEETLSYTLMQQRAAEEQCWEAEGRLNSLELGVLGAWRGEVFALRESAREACEGQRAAESAAATAQSQLVRVTELLLAQIGALERERDVLGQATHLTQRIAAEAELLPITVAERRRLGLPV